MLFKFTGISTFADVVGFSSDVNITGITTFNDHVNVAQGKVINFGNTNGTTGHNTDIEGFEESLKYVKYDVRGKDVLILGGGGVVPSIIFALKNMQAQNIIISNRTREKAENFGRRSKILKILFHPKCYLILLAFSSSL